MPAEKAPLFVNIGSSSIKFALYRPDLQLQCLFRGKIEAIGGNGRFEVEDGGGRVVQKHALAAADHDGALDALLDWLVQDVYSLEVVAAGHRVVHGGPRFREPVAITDGVTAYLESLVPLAPNHQSGSLQGIVALKHLRPELVQIACFDTAFHHWRPAVEQHFARPARTELDLVRRYGFHGLSYEYIAGVLPQHLGELADGKIVVAHLGHGASLCALHRRRSVATTMTFTPPDGLPMATRCGSIDPAVVLYLLQQGMSLEGIDDPLFLGIDTHALSEPAYASALEVLAANGVQAMLAINDECTPTPVISHAILCYNRGRQSGLADGILITPSHNPPDSGGFKYNPPNGGPADKDATGWIESAEPVYDRMEAPASADQKRILATLSPQHIGSTELAGETIRDILTRAPGNDAVIVGVKVVAESGWFAARPSGTEDIYKIYAESFIGPDHLRRIQQEAQAIVSDAMSGATHNPWAVLQTVSRDKLRSELADPVFRRTLDELLRARRDTAAAQGWFQQTQAQLAGVAYFSMEFMLSEALPIYSGGLGNVAGDQLKAASDLGVPVIGVGLLYQQGYFRQVTDKDGAQRALFPYNDPGQLPITPLRQGNGEWLRLEIALPGYSVWLRAWQVRVGRVKLYLLDSNDPANHPAHRGITSELYGDVEAIICMGFCGSV